MEIYLQGVGRHEAIEAKDLKPGMITVWNYGYKELVKSVEFSKSRKTLIVVIESLPYGKEFTRRFTASRLVAVNK